MNAIIHAHCQEMSPAYVRARFGILHHVITDPPYSRKVHRKAVTMATGKAGHNEFGFGHLTPYLRGYIAECCALATSWSLVFTDWEGVAEWREAFEAYDLEVVRCIPWVRWSMPQLSGDRPPSSSECVMLVHHKTRKQWNGLGNFECFRQKCRRGKKKHKTEKPLDLMLEIVELFTNAGETIYDPCAGRGTTILAAALLGRLAIGVECDANEARLAQERVDSPVFSKHDAERYNRYLLDAAHRVEERKRMKGHTADVVRRRKKNAGQRRSEEGAHHGGSGRSLQARSGHSAAHSRLAMCEARSRHSRAVQRIDLRGLSAARFH